MGDAHVTAAACASHATARAAEAPDATGCAVGLGGLGVYARVAMRMLVEMAEYTT
jgi:hypothetical protein